MSRSILSCALGLLLAVMSPLEAGAASLQRVRWEELSIVLGKQVSIAMPGGAVISGKATDLQPDALVVHVRKTSDPKTYAMGALRVPRATLRVLEFQKKGAKFRIIGTSLGALAGIVAGALAAVGISGGILSNNHERGAAVALIGIAGGATALGYLAGNAADKHSVTIEIVP